MRALVFLVLTVLATPCAASTEVLPRPKVVHPAAAVHVENRKNRTVARFSRSQWIGPMWQPDDSWDELVIGKDVTLTGNIVVPSSRKKPLIIRGENRSTSRLVGTNTQEWLRTETDLARRHSAIFVDTTAPVTISTLTSLDPDKYHFEGYSHTQLHVEHVDIIEDRLAYTTDGVGGGAGTTIEDAYIDTYDDAIKVYAPGMVIRNVTVVQNRNGAPLQFGWSDEQGDADIDGLTIIANEPDIYNQGVFGRAAQVGHPEPQASRIKLRNFHLIMPKGMKTPPLVMWGTPDGQKLTDFTLTVDGLCTGTPYKVRGDIMLIGRGSDDTGHLVTPDCP